MFPVSEPLFPISQSGNECTGFGRVDVHCAVVWPQEDQESPACNVVLLRPTRLLL